MQKDRQRFHSFEIAATLGFSHDTLRELLNHGHFQKKYPDQFNYLVYPGTFRLENTPPITGFWVDFSMIRDLIEYLNREVEYCQTDEWISRAQSLMDITYKNCVSLQPRIHYKRKKVIR